jgi:hypothetical protein
MRKEGERLQIKSKQCKVQNERRSVRFIFIVREMRKRSLADGYGHFGISYYVYT